MRAPLSLSLSLGVVARDDDDDDRREREREREGKNRKLFCNIFCAFSRVRKKFFRIFFLPLLRFQNAPRAMRSNNNNNDTNRREKERERERETSFSLSRDRKNVLLLSALLRVCAGVRKKTILINLMVYNKTRAKNFSSLSDICFVGFFALVFLD